MMNIFYVISIVFTVWVVIEPRHKLLIKQIYLIIFILLQQKSMIAATNEHCSWIHLQNTRWVGGDSGVGIHHTIDSLDSVEVSLDGWEVVQILRLHPSQHDV